eukprot:scaffold13764_cov65-Phaeocystis_antarctica.AAC.1
MRRRRLRLLGQRLVRDRSRRGRSLHQPPVGRLHALLAAAAADAAVAAAADAAVAAAADAVVHGLLQHRDEWPRLGLAVLLPLHLPRPDVCEPHGHRDLRATAHYSLLTTHYSLLTTHDSRLTTHDSRTLLTTHYSLLTAHCSLPTAYHQSACVGAGSAYSGNGWCATAVDGEGRYISLQLICGGGEAQGRRQGWGAKRKSPQTPQAVFTAAAPSTHMEWVGRGKGWDRGSPRCARGRGRLP